MPSRSSTTAEASRTASAPSAFATEFLACGVEGLDHASVVDVVPRQLSHAFQPAIGRLAREPIAKGLLCDRGDIQSCRTSSLREVVWEVHVHARHAHNIHTTRSRSCALPLIDRSRGPGTTHTRADGIGSAAYPPTPSAASSPSISATTSPSRRTPAAPSKGVGPFVMIATVPPPASVSSGSAATG